MKNHDLCIGAHTSTAGGVHNALLEGVSIGASTVQLFTSNQKQWKGRVFSQQELDLWFHTLKETGLKNIMSHDSYLINLGAPDPLMLEKSRTAFAEEVERCLALDLSFLNFHPGAALKESVEQCLDRIVESLLAFEEKLANCKLRLLIEATAGQGSTVGWSFEQLGYLISRVHRKVPIGVCIDTCHIFAAGYDIRTAEGWNLVLNQFDAEVGIKHLYAFHINDSMKGLGTRVDRHALLGKGEIGLDCFKFLVNDSRTSSLPMYLETPGGPEGWREEIILLKEQIKR